jgi:hypothetical protein
VISATACSGSIASRSTVSISFDSSAGDSILEITSGSGTGSFSSTLGIVVVVVVEDVVVVVLVVDVVVVLLEVVVVSGGVVVVVVATGASVVVVVTILGHVTTGAIVVVVVVVDVVVVGAGPYLRTTVRRLGVPPQGSPNTPLSAEIDADVSPIKTALTF